MSKTCGMCGKGALSRHTKPVEYSFRGHTFTVNQPGEWCDHCGEGILSGADLLATEDEIEQKQREILQISIAELIKWRKRFGLTQHDAGLILGVGIRGYHKYEKGTAEPSEPTKKLMMILDRHPELIEELRKPDLLARV